MVCFVPSVSLRKSCQRRDCSELGNIRNWLEHCTLRLFLLWSDCAPPFFKGGDLDGWMTCSLLNSISVISGRWVDYSERLCAMEAR